MAEPKVPYNYRESNNSTLEICLPPRNTNASWSEDTTDSRVLQRQMSKYSLAELIDQLANKRYVKANFIEDSWVETPSCVAALASVMVAEQASQELYEDADSTATLLQKGALEQLIENLDNPLNDVRETAAVALDYLLASRNSARCQRLNNEKSLEALARRMSDRKEGMRFTVTCILHSFYTQPREEGEAASDLVINFQQGALLSSLLSVTLKFERLSLLNQHLQHLLDLSYSRVSSGVSQYRAKAMINAGLATILNTVEKTIKDKDVERSLLKGELQFAQYILDLISKIRKELHIS